MFVKMNKVDQVLIVINANIHKALLCNLIHQATCKPLRVPYLYPNERTAMTSVAPADPAKQMHVDTREAQT